MHETRESFVTPEFCQRLRAREGTAWERLVNQWTDRFTKLAKGILYMRKERSTNADDIVVAMWSKAFIAAHQFEGQCEGELYSWLFFKLLEVLPKYPRPPEESTAPSPNPPSGDGTTSTSTHVLMVVEGVAICKQPSADEKTSTSALRPHQKPQLSLDHPIADSTTSLGDTVEDDIPDCIESLLDDERDKRIIQAMDTLDARSRDVVTLKFWGKLSNEEIVESLGLTPNQVRYALTNALINLRFRLQDGSDSP
jgi:RNA polymerase sigma factor (sigma-70 family)